ncbi:MAG: MucB/RseB C-terminal domain-containing protein [Thiolinea sp.]
MAGLAMTLGIFWGPPLQASEGEDLLKKMQSAVHALSYSGRLVFSRGNELSEFQIEHHPDRNQGGETVIKLDQSGNDNDHAPQQFSLINSSSLRLPAQQAYSIDIGGDAWVADLPCKVVVIRPKDKMRYLHRYCIHPDNGMLLKYSVMNREQQLLEQFMFTRLQIDTPEPARLDLASVQQGLLAAAPAAEQPAADMEVEMLGLDHWNFDNLPTGFRVSNVKNVPGKQDVHQVILSDGLTFVSVFIEPGQNAGDAERQLPASGATNILTHKIANYIITLVGEVPQETLRTIQNGLRYVGP